MLMGTLGGSGSVCLSALKHSDNVCCTWGERERESWRSVITTLFVLSQSRRLILPVVKDWSKCQDVFISLILLIVCLCVSPVLKVKMDRLLAAAQWICRRVRGLCSIPLFPRVAGGSLSSTAPTPTTICHLRPCPVTPPSTVRGTHPHPPHHTLQFIFHSCEALCRITPCKLYPEWPIVMWQYRCFSLHRRTALK